MRFIAAALLLLALPAQSAIVCFNEDCLPSVIAFDGNRAILGGKFANRTLLFRDGVWRETDAVKARPAPKCPREFRAKNYAESGEDEMWSVACAEANGFVYGGLSFYEGEGSTGRGGLLRLDRKTRRLEVRRLPMLRHVSINSIAADGDIVWFGTTVNGECVGEPVVHGLVRYQWSSGETRTYEGSDDGPIGGVIHDVVVRPDGLWVATDLGISRLDRQTSTWRHYSPVESDGFLIAEEKTPREILEPLLRKTPPDCLRNDSAENQLVEELTKFRPKLLHRMLK